MDSSHLAQHASTAGALFASIFLVATSTMRTMIPLRSFSILTNLVLILIAIPVHNYLVIACSWRCWCSIPTGCTRCCRGARGCEA
jgi:apolipoprotein N-acyltransferase